MVSRVAVMALVGILAVPILLGYGLNLSEETHTDYTLDKDQVNVTPLLYNSTNYNYVRGSPYQMNNNFTDQASSRNYSIYPVFVTKSTTLSSLKLAQSIFNTSNANWTIIFANYSAYGSEFYYDTNQGSVNAAVVGNGGNNYNYNNLYSIFYDKPANNVHMRTYDGTLQTIPNPVSCSLSTTGSPSIQVVDTGEVASDGSYVDISAGYFFYEPVNIDQFNHWQINFPEKSRSVVMTMNLDSITDPDYRISISASPFGQGSLQLIKSTVNGVVKWQAKILANNQYGYSYPEEIIDLYYNQAFSRNTYQITFEVPNKWTGSYNGNTVYYYSCKTTLDYVGGWPEMFGKAYSFQQYEINRTYGTLSDYYGAPDYIDKIIFSQVDSNHPLVRSPTVRIDDSYFAAFEYPSIGNATYDPSTLKTNPSTKLSDISKYGASITFAGINYDVTPEGDITLGTHKQSLTSCIFDSVPILGGGYENRINGEIVNISADPAKIVFNGYWVMSVYTDSQTATTYTKTEWIPGEFAWDGIDQNFLMVGLITCLGVFVGLGIYLRKTKSSIWPLLIVCGCAAGLFICMI